jgi:two-component system response regulator AtoC
MSRGLKHILVIDDEPALRHVLRLVLEAEGFTVDEAGDGDAGLARLAVETYDAILCDIRMPECDGLAFLRAAVARRRPETIIMMSAYGSLDTAIACMKEGAYDYISKPFKPDEVVLTLRKAEERLRLRRENARLRAELGPGAPPEPVVASAAMREIMTLVRRAAAVASPVLITGETGTGKEVVARALHEQGGRCDGPFVAVNCGAVPATLIESELFGHVRGAFTGADRDHPGLFVAASGGTLFLDEIGELPLEMQPKLLRVLQEGEVRAVGATRSRPVDVRIVAATARHLADEIRQGRFRSDLFYRLAVVEIAIPPLRERSNDLEPLAEYFLQRGAARQGRPAPVLSPAARVRLKHHRWPGNVRELQNVMEKALLFDGADEIDLDTFPWDAAGVATGGDELSLKVAVARIEQDHIRKALAASAGNRTRAARMLEISLRGLLYKLKEYGID